MTDEVTEMPYLLLDHPVGGGGTGVFLALDHAGLGSGAAVKQELSVRWFYRRRVGDDGGRPAAAGFRLVFRQRDSLQKFKFPVFQQVKLTSGILLLH